VASCTDPDDGAIVAELSRYQICVRDPRLIDAGDMGRTCRLSPRWNHAMVRLAVMERPDLCVAAAETLRGNRNILLAEDPDPLLARLVAAETDTPAVTLVGLDWAAGWATRLAVARWHLDHGGYVPALQAAAAIPILSPQGLQAALIATLAAAESGDLTGAATWWSSIGDTALADPAALALAERGCPAITGDVLLAVGRRTPADDPDRLLACLRLLLSRGDATRARLLAEERAGDFATGPVAETMVRIRALKAR
jgi:hypothetical protein